MQTNYALICEVLLIHSGFLLADALYARSDHILRAWNKMFVLTVPVAVPTVRYIHTTLLLRHHVTWRMLSVAIGRYLRC